MPDHDSAPLNATLQVQLSQLDKRRLSLEAARRHLKPGVLLRVIALDWLAANELVER